MYILNSIEIAYALKLRGLNSFQELAKVVGVHRNTLGRYLTPRSILPRKLENILDYLNLEAAKVLVRYKPEQPVFAPIATLIDELAGEFSDITFVLFGSRTKGRAKKYSDFDIGLLSQMSIPQVLYRRISMRAKEISENLPFFVQIVNLTKADKEFLDGVRHDAVFLSGKLSPWLEFLQGEPNG